MKFVSIKMILFLICILETDECKAHDIALENISNQKIFQIKNKNDSNREKRFAIDEDFCE